MTDAELSARMGKISSMVALLVSHINYLPQPKRSAMRAEIIRILKPAAARAAA